MQETHLKKVEKTEIFDTLRSFLVGESEFIPFSESRVDYFTWRARCAQLVKQGTLNGSFRFIKSREGETVGTWIMRTA